MADTGDINNMEYEHERFSMVQNQIKSRGVKDLNVLKAMLEVPRHLFVPLEYRDSSYEDHALPIGKDQTISQPYIVAIMTEALELKGDEKVLEIGTGSGYQTAVLSRIVKEVYTIEIIESHSLNAMEIINKLGYADIKFKVGSGWEGWIENAPYDDIIITAAAPRFPKKLIEQLKDGGRMVIPVGTNRYSQNLWQLTKHGAMLDSKDLGPVVFVPLVEKENQM